MATTIDAENAKQIRKSMDVLIQVTPETGDPIVINNDNLISCVVSLRSDLSILNPTLPESEINIEAYFDEDISEALAAIPDETPITYQAGYEGDMSPVRKFYLAEQITWANNVMSIHAVDAVHLLDERIGVELSPRNLLTTIIALVQLRYGDNWPRDPQTTSIRNKNSLETDQSRISKDLSVRDLVAAVMNLCHQRYSAAEAGSDTVYWYNFVDAGIPKFSDDYPASKWDIYENDCGEPKRFTERAVKNINVEFTELEYNYRQTFKLGTASVQNGSGAFLNFERTAFRYCIGFEANESVWRTWLDKYSSASMNMGVIVMVPMADDGHDYPASLPQLFTRNAAGTASATAADMLQSPDTPQELFKDTPPRSSLSDPKVYTQVVPWNVPYVDWSDLGGVTANITSMLSMLNWLKNHGEIDNVQSLELAICGTSFGETTTHRNYSSGRDGISASVQAPIDGKCIARNRNNIQMYPDGAYNSLLERSNITGSFIWKGDPRMQPRDVFTFHRLDGTDEVCTLENITITHEGGGTSAEITYRKGIC